MPKVTFLVADQNIEKTVEAPRGATVLETAVSAGLSVRSDCGGCCSCGSCEFTVVSGANLLSSQGDDEKKVLQYSGHAGSVLASTRLACQSRIEGEVKIRFKKLA